MEQEEKVQTCKSLIICGLTSTFRFAFQLGVILIFFSDYVADNFHQMYNTVE